MGIKQRPKLHTVNFIWTQIIYINYFVEIKIKNLIFTRVMLTSVSGALFNEQKR
jgi:hypothetical protein